MKHTFSRSFATRLSIYVLSFTLIIFATIMALFYYYSHQKDVYKRQTIHRAARKHQQTCSNQDNSHKTDCQYQRRIGTPSQQAHQPIGQVEERKD